MKLITELNEDIEYKEELIDEATGKKNLYITGPFMQYETVNRNGRVYPKTVMEREVGRYKREIIENNRGYGELNHPTNATINLDKVCILIKELDFQNDKKVYGKALVTSTPCGQIVRGLMESGANLGVSTRGLGSLRKRSDGINEVQEDFRLVTAADVVADPSAPAAFVNGIMENVEWFFNEATGEWSQEVQQSIKKMSTSQISENKLRLFEGFMHRLSNQIRYK